jgi:hypothetical protein
MSERLRNKNCRFVSDLSEVIFIRILQLEFLTFLNLFTLFLT